MHLENNYILGMCENNSKSIDNLNMILCIILQQNYTISLNIGW